MKAQNYIPPFRLEIRDWPTPGAEASAPWSFFDWAQTQSQAEDKINRHRIVAVCETRIVPNDPIAAVAATVIQDTPETLLLVEQLSTEKLALQRQLNVATAKLSELGAALAESLAPTHEPDAEPVKPPFALGQHLRDVHTGHSVKVTHHDDAHPQRGNPERGFRWVSLVNKPGEPDHTGFVPFKSAGCYEEIKNKAPLTTKPSHEEGEAPAGSAPAAAAPPPAAHRVRKPKAATAHRKH